MRIACLLLTLAALACFLVTNVQADPPDVTLKGSILCAKCTLKDKDFKKCTTAIKVKENDKDVVYYFKDKGSAEDYHVCGGGSKEGVVEGTVSEMDGKKWITPKKVTFDTK